LLANDNGTGHSAIIQARVNGVEMPIRKTRVAMNNHSGTTGACLDRNDVKIIIEYEGGSFSPIIDLIPTLKKYESKSLIVDADDGKAVSIQFFWTETVAKQKIGRVVSFARDSKHTNDTWNSVFIEWFWSGIGTQTYEGQRGGIGNTA